MLYKGLLQTASYGPHDDPAEWVAAQSVRTLFRSGAWGLILQWPPGFLMFQSSLNLYQS